MFDRFRNCFRFMQSADLRAVRPNVLWLSGIISGCIAIGVAIFSLSGYNTHISQLEISATQVARTIEDSMARFEYGQVELIADNLLLQTGQEYVLVIDKFGYNVYGNPETMAKLGEIRSIWHVPYKLHFPVDCAAGVSECGIFFLYSVENPLLIWIRLLLITAASFLIVALATARAVLIYVIAHVEKPISKLTHAMRETLRTGEYVRCEQSSNTELGLLSEAFDEMQSKLQESQAELERARRLEAVGIITSGVAHEFNNLLAVILGNLDMLTERTKQDPDDGKRLRELEVAACNSAMIVEKLLAYSRSRPSHEDSKRMTIKTLLENVQSLIGPFSANANVTFQNTCNDQLISGSGDMECALVTLTKNACEAVGDFGNVTINARPAAIQDCTAGKSPDKFVVVEVIDDGPGVPEAEKDRIFEPFFSTKPVGKGMGLGLWTVFKFVEQRGGKVSYFYRKKTAPHGSIFRLLLPVCPAEATQTTAPDEVAATGSLTGKKILIIEDEISLMTIYTTYCRKLGLDVLEATTVGEGIDKIKQYGDNIDLVLSDFQLPDGFGTEALKLRKSLNPAALTILLSGNIDENNADLSCADTALFKPVRLHELEKIIRAKLALSADQPAPRDHVTSAPQAGSDWMRTSEPKTAAI